MKMSRWILVLATVLFSNAAFAGLIDAGSIDDIVNVTDDLNGANPACGPGSDPTTETCWASDSVTGLNYTTKTDPVSVEYQGTLAIFELAGTPEYYIIKNAQTWILMKNNANLNYGVLDTSDPSLNGFLLNLGKSDQTQISHVTEFNNVSVPEPSTLALLGAALGLIAIRRKKQA